MYSPLYFFCVGVDGMFIAIANTTEKAHDLYERAALILSKLEMEAEAEVKAEERVMTAEIVSQPLLEL